MSQPPLLSYNFYTGNDVFSDVVELVFPLAREEDFRRLLKVVLDHLSMAMRT